MLALWLTARGERAGWSQREREIRHQQGKWTGSQVYWFTFAVDSMIWHTHQCPVVNEASPNLLLQSRFINNCFMSYQIVCHFLAACKMFLCECGCKEVDRQWSYICYGGKTAIVWPRMRGKKKKKSIHTKTPHVYMCWASETLPLSKIIQIKFGCRSTWPDRSPFSVAGKLEKFWQNVFCVYWDPLLECWWKFWGKRLQNNN